MMRLPFFAIFIFVFMLPAHVNASAISFFNMEEQRSGDVTPFPKWTSVMTRFSEQTRSEQYAYCHVHETNICMPETEKQLLTRIKDESLPEQLDAINRWGNEHPYIEDQVNWGMEDFWETPKEFLDISGDCEDYAISKYYMLRAMGVKPGRLRIIVLQDLNLGGIIHAVLGVYGNDTLYILDNQSEEVLPALSIYHYRPIFGINEEAWWAYYPKLQ